MLSAQQCTRRPILNPVGLQAMVVSHDSAVTNLFSAVLERLGIGAQRYVDELQAGLQLERDRFEAIILDFDTIARTVFLVDRVRNSRCSHAALVFGVASEVAALERALQQKINVSFQRPLQRERVDAVLRAAYGLMLHDRRQYFRYGASVPVRLKRKSGEEVHCTSINVSQNGAALNIPAPLELSEDLEICFAIPEVQELILARGTVIWHDRHGKAGVRFDCSSKESQTRLAEWLDAHFMQTVSKSTKD